MKTGSGFTTTQWLNGLLPEITSARNVLASADRLLRQEGPLERDLDAVIAAYSIGVERLLKLALGASAVSEGKGWPQNMGFTRAGWGHALDEMDTRLREICRLSIQGNEWPQKKLLESWIGILDNDPVWRAVIETLRNYADSGRYHHLDLVKGGAIKSKSSREMWGDVENLAISGDPALNAHYQKTLEGADFALFEIELRVAVADVIKRWVSIICLFGFHGILGEDWKVMGADALPDDALKTIASMAR